MNNRIYNNTWKPRTNMRGIKPQKWLMNTCIQIYSLLAQTRSSMLCFSDHVLFSSLFIFFYVQGDAKKTIYLYYVTATLILYISWTLFLIWQWCLPNFTFSLRVNLYLYVHVYLWHNFKCNRKRCKKRYSTLSK